ncbi:hypothetical protein GCM10011510_09520 [Streptococcus himalayensis]|uniref:Uncharacterized protein n=1 Tax=Streptococcus himalayensis TaxID=1888195 RepID=A0A917A8B9_9STRE|nr:hypothetical protein GCM10011510_09520 [Streptococcus himalayensis]
MVGSLLLSLVVRDSFLNTDERYASYSSVSFYQVMDDLTEMGGHVRLSTVQCLWV